MCGIAGLFRPDGATTQDELARMNEPLCHRGPDDEGYFREGPAGLAHRRLSIIDLQTGQQPIYSEDESVVVIFNGEIYNYQSLRTDLESAGHTFSTETDTEVLVHAYEEFGVDFLPRLDGMFAFALYDRDREQLLLARDPLGIKPLYVGGASGDVVDTVAFGSELPAVLASDLAHGGLDQAALAHYFAFGFVPAPMTAFQHIESLQPGERLVVSSEGVDRDRFYQPSISHRAPGIDAAATRLRELVEGAVERRLMADVPLGAFLSGGIDSSIVVGTMAELAEEPVKTFTVGYESSVFDESWAAREVAEYHDTDHHEMIVTADEVRELVPEMLGRLGQPFADQSLIPTAVVSRKTADHVKVALSGDGADELFAGYDKYLGEYYSRYYRMVPGPVRRGVIEPAVDSLPVSRGSRAGEYVRQLQKFTRGGVESLPARHLGWLRIADSETDRAVPGLSVQSTGERALTAEHDALATVFQDDRDELGRMLAVDTRYSLPNQMLRKVDLASMHSSLEVRVPFLDTEVVEYAMSLPTEYKISRAGRKRVLKRAFADILPETILNRSKQGFDMPIGEWLKDELADDFQARLDALDTDLIDGLAVREIYDEHATGRGEHGKFLWAVYVFAVWTDRMREQGLLE